MALLGTLAISIAVVVGFSISLLGGVGSTSGRTATAIPQQKFFGIAQGISRFDNEDLQTMAATGIGMDRFLLDWAAVQPTPNGPLAWPDKAIGALASHGIEAIPYLWGSPKWVAAAQQVAPVDNPQQENAWRSFLQAAVERYGPKVSYWANEYLQQYGANAKPVPIRSWQIWNEPNLKKFFTPGADVHETAQKYARLLQISRDAIKGQDPQARIVLAGLPGFGDVTASEFFAAFYGVPGVKGDYDAAALHPYAPTVEDLGHQIDQLRATMAEHHDQATPLWLTELRPFPAQQGPRRSGPIAERCFRVDPQPPTRLECAARLLVRLARSGTRIEVGGHLQLLPQRGIAQVHARPEAVLPGVQEVCRRRLKPRPLVDHRLRCPGNGFREPRVSRSLISGALRPPRSQSSRREHH